MARMIDADELEMFPYSEVAGTEEQIADWIEQVGLSGDDTASRARNLCWKVIEGFINVVKTQPTLTQPNDFTPVQHGRWVKPVPGDGENYCSVCHAVQPWFYGYGYYDSDYCPNCGACMDAKEELKDGKE